MTARPLPARPLTLAVRAAGAMVLAMVLASCSLLNGGDKKPEAATAKADPSIVASAPSGLEKFYSQEVVWQPCEGEFQCAKVMVPLDYANPAGDTIQIAALRAPSTGKKTGSLLVNPGGPGASGYDFVKDAAGTHFSQGVRSTYDLVGFDPRGVKRSAPVTCMTDAERDASRAKIYDLQTDAGLAEALADNKAIGAQCAAQTGPVLAHIDTVSAAKDLDVLRAVVNDSKLNYLGYSYGTFLGSTYASLFPDNVGRMVLDGALDPSISNEDLTSGQARAFEKAIRSYVASCQRQDKCPLGGDVDSGVKQIQDLISAVQQTPRTAKDGRQVNATMFVSGLITPLYNDQSWPALTQALEAAMNGDVSLVLRLADIGADRAQDGTYTSNSTLAFNAVNCLDYPMVSDTAGMRAEEQRLEQDSPTFGYFFAYGGVNCADWPYKNLRTPAPVEYRGDSPIVVIGTTGDPATPVDWAASLRKQLGNASLLTWKGEGHTAYGRANSCLEDAVDGYLVSGKIPADNTVC
ncbi:MULTISPECIES: alpha/beta hydrolase [unclassified Arthrobacter]|uniref:alpha/beta hydrolase n=1 Tax=unclassified Arthrobacter TaxID=235627 RepID=UPI001C8479DA|nr:alpha/beta hydrolase [Arthrobacter sp. MAHUQ-56]MBX7444222.1 alpha/beta hydrolase [Arthrobacter sp. MAHUQ-56]